MPLELGKKFNYIFLGVNNGVGAMKAGRMQLVVVADHHVHMLKSAMIVSTQFGTIPFYL